MTPVRAKPRILTVGLVVILCGYGYGQPAPPRFQLLPPEQSGVTFRNTITETEQFNCLNYEYVYNGGGVAVGDINNDGLPDLYFTGNQVSDQLYLNKGDLRFENITKAAGIKHIGWHTGVNMVDIDADGWLDIYVCRSGLESPRNRANLLYVNNGNGTFTERASEYGLADTGHSVQSVFFDHDLDGDLDMYVLNHPVGKPPGDVQAYYKFLAEGKHETDRLYRNDGGRFADVTADARLVSFGFRHGVAVGDVNDDGWPDLYVCTDFDEPDKFYINNRGRFEDRILELTRHTSMFSMGCDIADFNNDGMLDVYVVDMTPEGHVRSRINMAAMSPGKFWQLVRMGYHHQYMVNTLQINTGKGFSEVAQVAGVSRTDWSWAPLFADFDNDGLKDLFVTNGIKRDVLDNDARLQISELSAREPLRFSTVLTLLPQNLVPNYMFRNTGDLQFDNVGDDWGLGKPVNSNGAVYADLDRDGDLDLVINNMEEVAHVYRNTTSGHKSLRIVLKGPASNPYGIGAKVKVTTYDPASGLRTEQFQELYLTRGYLSAVEPVLHFGLGDAQQADVRIIWPDGTVLQQDNVAAGEVTLAHRDARLAVIGKVQQRPQFQEVSRDVGLTLRHHENKFDDFARELLLPHKQSENGPMLSLGDANGDGLTDFYFPGSMSFDGTVILQDAQGHFYPAPQPDMVADKAHEDAGSLFFDADGDGDQDLYVVSGGSESLADSFYQDRLYVNDGTGNFKRSRDALPTINASGSCVIANDVDADGDLDLFVGGRVVPGAYPRTPRSYLLENDQGIFSDATEAIAPGLASVGMVTSAVFSDYDSDGDADLLVVGEWIPLVIFRNDSTHFTRTDPGRVPCSSGWWFNVTASDLDNDGDDDYVLGNIGRNNKFQPTPDNPLKVYGNDFDGNGTHDIVLSGAADGKYVPVRGRACSSAQMPFILGKFPTYRAFAEASLEQIFGDALSSSVTLDACDMSSVILWNEGSGVFRREELPVEAQLAPLRAVIVFDIDNDGRKDIIGAGNMYGAEVETVRYDAGTGVCLIQGAQGFKSRSHLQSGFYVPGDARDLKLIRMPRGYVVLVANNAGHMQAYRLE